MSTPYFIFVRSVVVMENQYIVLVHACANQANTSTLDPLRPMHQLDNFAPHCDAGRANQHDSHAVLNALLGWIQTLEAYIIERYVMWIPKVKWRRKVQN